MWLVIGVLLVVAWATAFVVFKVTSLAIHLLILAAVVSLAVHTVQRIRHRHVHVGRA
jgi:hypothetical protein